MTVSKTKEREPNPIFFEIEAFLEETGMAVTTFGIKAANDANLVKRLKAGSWVLPPMADKIRTYIKNNSPEKTHDSGTES